jgi:hypothetical protein
MLKKKRYVKNNDCDKQCNMFFHTFFYLGEEYSMLMKKNMLNDTTCYDESYYHCDPIACLSIR